MIDETENVSIDSSDHDCDILKEFYVCFDRPAFRIRFEHESDLEALMEAIDDTIAAINTGVKRTRSGLQFGTPVEGKAYLDDKGLRTAFDEVVDILSAAKLLYVRAKAAGYFFVGSRSIAFHRDYQEEANRVAVMIDEARNRVIEIVNGIYTKLAMRKFSFIETPERYEEGAGVLKLKTQLPKRKSSFLTILEVLELKPNFFGVGINLNELLRKLSSSEKV